MKIENAAVIALALGITLSFYFAILSFQTVDENLRKQLAIFAASFLVASIVIFISLMIYLGIRNVFPTFSIFSTSHFNSRRTYTTPLHHIKS